MRRQQRRDHRLSINGADAAYFVAKASWLHRIPDELSFVHPRSSNRSQSPTARLWPPTGSTRATKVAVIGAAGRSAVCDDRSHVGLGHLIEQAHPEALGLQSGKRTIDRARTRCRSR
jgi:hypothetical protein